MAAVQSWRLILTVEGGWPGEDVNPGAIVPTPDHLGRRMASHLGLRTRVARAQDPDDSPDRPNRLFDVDVDGSTTAAAVRDATAHALSLHSTGNFVRLTINIRVESPDGTQWARGAGLPYPR